MKAGLILVASCFSLPSPGIHMCCCAQVAAFNIQLRKAELEMGIKDRDEIVAIYRVQDDELYLLFIGYETSAAHKSCK